MAAGPRAYGVAVERKLYRVARGTCYYPGCKRAIMFDVENQPVCDVEIAHIRGAEKSSARYSGTMADAERSGFANLILLCSAHHKLVDRDEFAYPVELLEQWKLENEDSDLATLAGVGLNEKTLADILEEVTARMQPRRDVRVELLCGLLLPPGTGGVMTSPDLVGLKTILASNPGWDSFPRVLVTSIRNTGSAAVEIESVDFYFLLDDPDGSLDDPPQEGRVTGQDTFPGQNPRLPHRVEDGSALHWFTKFEHVDAMIRVGNVHGRAVPSIRSEARLATGETVSSPPLALDEASD